MSLDFNRIYSNRESYAEEVLAKNDDVSAIQDGVKKEKANRLWGYENPLREGLRSSTGMGFYQEKYTTPESLKLSDHSSYEEDAKRLEKELEKEIEDIRDVSNASSPENVERAQYLINNAQKVPSDLYSAMIKQAKYPDEKIDIPQPELKKLSLSDKLKMKLGMKSRTNEENKQKQEAYNAYKAKLSEYIKSNPMAAKANDYNFESIEAMKYSLGRLKDWQARAEERFDEHCNLYAVVMKKDSIYKDAVHNANKSIEEYLPEATQSRQEQLEKNDKIAQALKAQQIESARLTSGITDAKNNTGIDRLAVKAELRAKEPKQSIGSLYKRLRGISSPAHVETKQSKQTTLPMQVKVRSDGGR